MTRSIVLLCALALAGCDPDHQATVQQVDVDLQRLVDVQLFEVGELMDFPAHLSGAGGKCGSYSAPEPPSARQLFRMQASRLHTLTNQAEAASDAVDVGLQDGQSVDGHDALQNLRDLEIVEIGDMVLDVRGDVQQAAALVELDRLTEGL